MLLFAKGVLGQTGKISFSAPTIDPASKLTRVDVIWSEHLNVGAIKGFHTAIQVVALSAGTDVCINWDLTQGSLNPIFPGWGFSHSPSECRLNVTGGMNYLVPDADVPLFTLFFAGDPGSALRVKVNAISYPPPYYVPFGSSLSNIINGTAYADAVFASYTLGGFIERSGNPAPQCEYSPGNSVANGGIPAVTVVVESESNDNCLALPGNDGTGNSGYYFQYVYSALDYKITPFKNNGNSCGVSSFDAALVVDHVQNQTFTEIQEYYAADVDLNNSTTYHDVININEIIAGTFNPPSGYASWRFIPTEFYSNMPNPPVDGQFLIEAPGDISVEDVQANQSSLDFIAIKRGDVNQSCSSCYQSSFSPDEETQARSALPAVELYVDDHSVRKGESLIFNLKSAGVESLRAFSFALGYDPDYLSVEEVTSGDLPLDLGVLVLDVENACIKYAWTSQASNGYNLPDGGGIYRVRATALRDAPSLAALFRLSPPGSLINNEFFNADLNGRGVFEWPDFASKTNMKLGALPNPFQQEMTVDYFLPAPAMVDLRMFDLSGREVARFSDWLEAGSHQWRPVEMSKLPSGVYQCHLTAGLEHKTIKVLKY